MFVGKRDCKTCMVKTTKLKHCGNLKDDLERKACLSTGGRKSGKIIRMEKSNEIKESGGG